MRTIHDFDPSQNHWFLVYDIQSLHKSAGKTLDDRLQVVRTLFWFHLRKSMGISPPTPHTQKFIACIPKDAKIVRSEDVFVEHPVCVISVAVLVAVVYQCIFLLVFIVLYKKMFLSVWSHKGLSFLNLGLIVFWTGTPWYWSGADLYSRCIWVLGLTIIICNKITAKWNFLLLHFSFSVQPSKHFGRHGT